MTLTRRTPLTRTPMPRGTTPMRKVNRTRRATNHARAYGGPERIAWVRSLPCLVAWSGGCAGAVENAHTETGGMGRKADARTVVPLCHQHHRLLHDCGRAWFEEQYSVDLSAEAARVEALWRARCT